VLPDVGCLVSFLCDSVVCKICCKGSFAVNEECTGLATKLMLSCTHCTTSHCIESKKSVTKKTKSELCQYDINIKFSVALQMIGVGGQHASTLAAFLDLPESHKWPRHFTTLEKFMHSGIDMIKIKSQEMSTKTEVSQAVQADGEAAHLPIPRIMASFDMGWQVRSSGGKYGSCTGHAMLIGAHSRKIMDSIVYNKRCTICNKHEQRRIETGQIVKKHECMKNYDGTSKSMKAAALVSMLCHTPQEKGVSIKAIISDDDSNGRKKAQHIDRGGQLPTHVEEPNFFADPSHRKRVFARAIYNLANASMK
jgi:ribosomal protein L37AE/L43A